MKKLLVSSCIYLAASVVGYSQQYDTIRVGIASTVHIIFNSPVLNYDLGSGEREENGVKVSDVLITQIGDRLKLAASIERFETTNLFVETETAYFNLILKYSANPKKLSFYLGDDKADKVKGPGKVQKETLVKQGTELEKAKEEKIIELTIQDLAKQVFEKSNVIPEIGESTQRMKYFLNGIYVKGDYLFFRVNVLNEANITYELGYEGFFINDKKNKGTKKTPVQPIPMKPLYIYNDDVKSVGKKVEISKVYVFKKFTLEPKKVFTIEFWEDGEGQRKVELNIPPDKLLSAKTI